MSIAVSIVEDDPGVRSSLVKLINSSPGYRCVSQHSSAENALDERLGAAVGELVREIVGRGRVRRVVLCGGDTSSHAMQQLPIRALTWAAPIAPGAPLCMAHAPGTEFDGVEFVLKGGQVGKEDFFGTVRGH